MAAAMGLDTISTYVFWNAHELAPQCYRFDGRYDVRAFLRIAREEGLNVILRPGPYVCAEWDFGGLPAWLFAQNGGAARTCDARFMEPVRRWLYRLGEELAEPLRDGTVIAVQLENEYGAFAADPHYMNALREIYWGAGLGAAPLFTIDQPADLRAGALDGLATGVTFAAEDARSGFEGLRAFRPPQAPFCAEFWAGWFDHWGEPHQVRDDDAQVAALEWMLAQGASVNFYMFCGGTNFGFSNGANYDETSAYLPDTTSYDYLAALDEAGRPREKFFRFRDAIARYRDGALPDVPPAPETIAIPSFTLDRSASPYDLLQTCARSDRPLPMESLQQSFGYVVYRTLLDGPVDGALVLEEARDYALILVDGIIAGRLDRRLGETAVRVRSLQKRPVLEIVVENSGRMNYGRNFANDRKGICGKVELDGREVTQWECYAMPMDDLSALRFTDAPPGPMAFQRGDFNLERPGDTFLDVRSMGKGTIWINGHHVGRFWRIGPQQTLYVPGAWLRRGLNELVAFDLHPANSPVLRGVTEPLYGANDESARS